MVCCAIAGCTNHNRHQKNLGIHFHRFPKNKETKLKWINACKRADSFVADIARVCSVHFDEFDYRRDLMSELLKLPMKIALKTDSVPHLNLPICSTVVNSNKPACNVRKMRAEKLRIRKEVQLLQSSLNNDTDCVGNKSKDQETGLGETQDCSPNVAKMSAGLEYMKDILSATGMEEHVLQEPHRIFIPVPDTDIKKELLDEGELPSDQLSDESAFPAVDVVIKEQVDLEANVPAIKQEFISEKLEHEHHIDMCFSTDVSIPVEENVILDGPFSDKFEATQENSKVACASPLSEIPQHNTDQYSIGKYHCDVTGPDSLLQDSLIHTGNKKFQCDICNKSFSQSNNLSKHQLIHSSVKSYQCKLCNKAFAQPQGLSKHSLIHSAIKKFLCNICNKTFTQSSYLSRHQLIHSDVKHYQCDVCNKSFAQHGGLSKHKLIHIGIKRHKCEVCGKAFYRSDELSSHRAIHSGIKKYHCDVCNKAFGMRYNLLQHKSIHSEIKRFHCDLCNKEFRWSSDLSRHKLSHSDEKPYQCNICNNFYITAYGLSQHKLIHTGIKKHQCDVCNKAFTQSGNLKEHKLIHSDIKKFMCDICNKVYASQRYLSRHKVTHLHVKNHCDKG